MIMTKLTVLHRSYGDTRANRVDMVYSARLDVVAIVTLHGDVDVPLSALRRFVEELDSRKALSNTSD